MYTCATHDFLFQHKKKIVIDKKSSRLKQNQSFIIFLLTKMFEEIFDVKRGRNMLDMILSPISDDDLIKDYERWKFEGKEKYLQVLINSRVFVIQLDLQ